MASAPGDVLAGALTAHAEHSATLRDLGERIAAEREKLAVPPNPASSGDDAGAGGTARETSN